MTLRFDQPDLIELRLDDVEELFEARPANARTGRGGGPAGVVQLERRLALKPPAAEWPRTLRISCPAGAGEIDAGMLGQAFRRWCETELEAINQHRELVARERRRAWLVGMAFFIACLLLAGFLEAAWPFSDFVSVLLSETVIIAGWVGLWHPLDLTLYAWWPYARRRKLLEQMRGLNLVLAPR